MHLLATLALLPLFATPGVAGVAAPAGERELASAVGSRRPGPPVDCIPLQNQSSTQVVAGTAIVYGFGTRLYVDRPVEGAEILRQNDVLVAQVGRNQLCRQDTVTLFDPSSRLPRGVVTLGPFVPYSRSR